MDMLSKSIIELCQDFIKVADQLYKDKEITYEQYIEMTKFKFEFINKME